MIAKQVAEAFVSAINGHDADALALLMTEGHALVDGLGNRVVGKAAVLAAWRGYFAMVPDYWIEVRRVIEGDGVTAVFGRAGGTYAPTGRLDPDRRWEIPAAWLAELEGGKLASWSVFADNLPMRRLMAGAAGMGATPAADSRC